ncbi:calcium-binding protein [Streptomyces sp. NPDC005562]|uniref:calcium-binding protein n=1 Tax=Streptomyces sp. NPDC005562 TaxID=3154890 RepID=UPI0033A02CF4
MFARPLRTHRLRPLGVAAVLGCSAVLAGLTGAPSATAAAPTAAAPAATVQPVSGSRLEYRAAPGQVNQLDVKTRYRSVGENEGVYDVTLDDRVAITTPDGSGCGHPDAADLTRVLCTIADPGDRASDLTTLGAYVGDKDDSVTVAAGNSAYLQFHGEAGNDTLKGDLSTALYGEDGADHLDTSGGVYSEGSFGGAGNDTLTHCVSDCDGGPGNDTLRAASGTVDHTLTGGDGDDTVYGNADGERILGGRGNDKLYGAAGDDVIYGNSGDDLLHGGPGNDTLSGGPGRNKVYQD